MRRVLTWLTAVLVAWAPASVSRGHVCNNIYIATVDRLIVKPEKDVSTLRKSDRFRVYVQNNYPAALTRVRLTAKATDPDATVSVTPRQIDRMRSGERRHFTVGVKVRDRRARNFSIQFGIAARQLKFRLVKEPTEEELRACYRRGDLSTHIHVADSLARRGHQDAVEFLKRTIRGAHSEYRGRAARLVGRMGHKGFAPFLRERLAAERSPWVRGNMLLGLGCLRLDEDRARFVKAAREADRFVRSCALAALAMRGERKAVERLKPGLEDRDILIRIVSAWGCGVTKDPKAIQVLDAAFDYRHGNVSRQRTLAGEALLYLAGLAR